MGEQGRPKEKDAFLATMFRLDVQRVSALRRAASGKTRCPECDLTNDASARRCVKCGALLYPVEEYDERPLFKKDKEEEDL
jgi:uncharacterized paraquat-inducible protein A